MRALDAVGHALVLSGTMAWQVFWPLVLGFALAAVVQALVRRSAVERLLGDSRPRTVAVAAALGAGSSSCSYAAVALARSLVRKGASFPVAMAFEIASTNLVVELGVLLVVLIGWQFTAAEFFGGGVMIVLVAIAFRFVVDSRLIGAAREQSERGLAGSMEGHAAMDMGIAEEGGVLRRLRSPSSLVAVSQIFVMEWAAVLRDIVAGMLIAGAVAAWVPDAFWRHLFIAGHPLASSLVGPLVGPVVSLLSFVCSVGNVPLAAVLWKDGISFGGVVAFVFADLIIVPILLIYRKYYGTKMMLCILATFYVAMVLAGYASEALFGGLGAIPTGRRHLVASASVGWSYTTWLDIVAAALVGVLCAVFVRSGAAPMLREMGGMATGGPGDGIENPAARS